MRLFYFFILETNSKAQERLRLKMIATDLGCFLTLFHTTLKQLSISRRIYTCDPDANNDGEGDDVSIGVMRDLASSRSSVLHMVVLLSSGTQLDKYHQD